MTDDGPAARPEKVGYGNPPKRSQFKPGTSGNPGGRPKRRPGLADALWDQLTKEVTVREGGKKRKMSKIDVILKKLTDNAAAGNHNAIRTTLALAERQLGPDGQRIIVVLDAIDAQG